jgi:plastocyanin
MMRLASLTAGLLIPLLAGCGFSGPAYDEATPADVDAVVEMTSTMNFSPETVTIPAGGTVEWRNTSIVTHTVTADPALAKDSRNVRLPEGVEPFDSGDVPPGEIYRHTFEAPGEYRYLCKPHEDYGMRGTVIVTPAG